MSEIGMGNPEGEKFHTEDYDRSLAEYEHQLNISRDDLKGKVVLDIGSGRHLRFAKEAAKEGIEVISVNPEYAVNEDMRKDLQTHWSRRFIPFKEFPTRIEKQVKSRVIVARAQELPLEDESVDVVLGLYSAPAHIQEFDDKKKAFDEMMRVLKPGGTGHFKYFIHNKNEVDEIMETYKDKGYSIDEKIVEGWNNEAEIKGRPTRFVGLKIEKPE